MNKNNFRTKTKIWKFLFLGLYTLMKIHITLLSPDRPKIEKFMHIYVPKQHVSIIPR